MSDSHDPMLEIIKKCDQCDGEWLYWETDKEGFFTGCSVCEHKNKGAKQHVIQRFTHMEIIQLLPCFGCGVIDAIEGVLIDKAMREARRDEVDGMTSDELRENYL